MQVTKEAAVSMYQALGIKTAGGLTPARLIKKLNKANEEYDRSTKTEDVDANSLLSDILDALDAGETIEIGEDPPEVEEAPAPKKTKKAPQKGKGQPAESKPTKEVDQFGTRIGTNAARIAAVLTHDPQSITDIAKAADTKYGLVYGHLRKLASDGKIAKTEEGYALLGEKPAKKGKGKKVVTK